MRKLSLREVKSLAQGHTASKGRGRVRTQQPGSAVCAPNHYSVLPLYSHRGHMHRFYFPGDQVFTLMDTQGLLVTSSLYTPSCVHVVLYGLSFINAHNFTHSLSLECLRLLWALTLRWPCVLRPHTYPQCHLHWALTPVCTHCIIHS